MRSRVKNSVNLANQSHAPFNYRKAAIHENLYLVKGDCISKSRDKSMLLSLNNRSRISRNYIKESIPTKNSSYFETHDR